MSARRKPKAYYKNAREETLNAMIYRKGEGNRRRTGKRDTDRKYY